MEFSEGQSFGLSELYSGKQFDQGRLVVEEEDTTLFFLKSSKLWSMLSEKQLF
jgi:hypothetical protein